MSTPATLLIANRGEIAIRIARTAARMGWRVVAVVAEGDPSPHTQHWDQYWDQVVPIPSYLDIDAIVSAARESGAGFVHPGYGFLSERPAFAQALADAAITLVGPSATVMEQMGDKAEARRLAIAAGVPVVPGYALGEVPADAYPVLVKAAAGGGGKGMRVVHRAEDLPEAMAAAAREAQAAFGDDRLLIEAFVEHGRHIEVQVFGDSEGRVIHLGERDCSVQRRHQKVIEESPAPTLTDQQRLEIHTAAVTLAASVGYVGAGTVEFLLDATTGAFYFLEMNTRLQVEHPVTELVTGIDLVEWQLRVALGEPLPLSQDEVRFHGHAIEARIYAEDPYAGFLPQAGIARYVEWPVGMPRRYADYLADEAVPGLWGRDELGRNELGRGRELRVDAALYSGLEVSARFDPMLAKVIAHGSDREEARRLLIDGLDGTVIAGLTTNTGFARELLASVEFADAAIETGTLDAVAPDLQPSLRHARRLAAAVLGAGFRRTGALASDGWRLGSPPQPTRVLLDEPTEVEDLGSASFGWFAYAPDPGRGQEVSLPRAGLEEELGSGDLLGRVWRTSEGIEVVCRGQRTLFLRRDPFANEGELAGDGQVLAPMPGAVLRIDVAEGERVEAGQALGVLEAMKMEFTLRAPHPGVVAEVAVAAGDQVGLGERLLVVEEEQ